MSSRAGHTWDSVAFLRSLCLGACIHHPRSEQGAISVLLKGSKLAAPGQTQSSVMVFLFLFFLTLWCFGKKKINLAFNDDGSQIKFQILASFENPKRLVTLSPHPLWPQELQFTAVAITPCFSMEVSSSHLHGNFRELEKSLSASMSLSKMRKENGQG